jgi:hypothetical protein
VVTKKRRIFPEQIRFLRDLGNGEATGEMISPLLSSSVAAGMASLL